MITIANIDKAVRATPDSELGYRTMRGRLVSIANGRALIATETTRISGHGLATTGATRYYEVPVDQLETQAQADARRASLSAVADDGFPPGF